MVLLRFAEPIRKPLVWEFIRIRLTAEMLDEGEADYYRPTVARLGYREPRYRPMCSRCGQLTRQVDVWRFRCDHCRRTVHLEPPRGVLRVLIPQDGLIRLSDGTEWVSKCVLVLDRRYSEEVLAGVYRTAGTLAEQLGVRVL